PVPEATSDPPRLPRTSMLTTAGPTFSAAPATASEYASSNSPSEGGSGLGPSRPGRLESSFSILRILTATEAEPPVRKYNHSAKTRRGLGSSYLRLHLIPPVKPIRVDDRLSS